MAPIVLSMPHSLASLIAAASLLLLGIALALWCRRHYHAWRTRRRFARGAQGERKARDWLVRHGFTILEEQAHRTPSIWLDGHREEFQIKADFLVKRKGRRAVVDAKTGTTAIDPASSHTRRQMFEYFHCYDVDDVYVFDAEHGRLREIRFGPAAQGRIRRWTSRSLVIAFVLGLLVALAAGTAAGW